MSSSNGHNRNGSVVDPFSEPDVYYGDETLVSRQMKDHRRAFSQVSSDGSSYLQICRELRLFLRRPPNRT